TLSSILFPLICMSFGTHRCYRRLGKQLPDPLVRLVQYRVHYIPWSVSCSSTGALGVFRVPLLPPVVKDSDVVTVGSTVCLWSCHVGFSTCPPLIPLILWHQLPCRVKPSSGCIYEESVDYVN